MSQTLYISAIDLDRLVAVFGSDDTAMLDAVLRRAAVQTQRHDVYFATFPDVTVYRPLAEALEQIVRGAPDPHFSPLFQFEHAAALLADTLGKPLDAECFKETSPSFSDDVDELISAAVKEAGQQEAVWPSLASVFRRGTCFDIPLDQKWPLGSGYLTGSEVESAAAVAEACDLAAAAGILQDLRWPDDTVSAAEQYVDWLRHAAVDRRGLYFHK
jgi:hypothetical protein